MIWDEAENAVILAKKRCIYCSPEKWEKIRRRARKAGMPISRLFILCCRHAASANAPPEPPGHPLALPEDTQRSFHEDSRILVRATSIAAHAPGGGNATLAIHEVLQFLLLSEGARGS